MNLRVFPGNWNSSTQVIQFLEQSKQNIVVDQREKEYISKNLFLIFCAICRIPFRNRSGTLFEDRLFTSYLDEIVFGKERHLLYIDQLSIIKSLINRPVYALNERQMKMLQAKFGNLYENRMRNVGGGYEEPPSLRQQQQWPPRQSQEFDDKYWQQSHSARGPSRRHSQGLDRRDGRFTTPKQPPRNTKRFLSPDGDRGMYQS